MKTVCPTCKTTHEFTEDHAENQFGKFCNECNDADHVRFVKKNAKRGIYPYGKEYAAKLLSA